MGTALLRISRQIRSWPPHRSSAALQGIVARNVAPLQTAVVSVCTIHAGETFNVIPPAVEMTGTIRTFEPEVRTRVLQRFDETVRRGCRSHGLSGEIDLQRFTPATVNHPDTAAVVQAVARQLFPDADIDSANYVTMGSEDFASCWKKCPVVSSLLALQIRKKGWMPVTITRNSTLMKLSFRVQPP